jgi:hypothetical protein
MEETTVFVVIGVVLIVALTGGLIFWFMEQRRKQLHARFGPEYERALAETRNPRRAEAVLAEREKRVKRLGLRMLSQSEQAEFTSAWQHIQARFVDEPGEAVLQAEHLLSEVMRARGYPDNDFDARTADVSVNHPRLVQSYRDAHAIALRNQRGEAGTEDLRRAVVYYRALFEDLLESRKVACEKKQGGSHGTTIYGAKFEDRGPGEISGTGGCKTW